MIKFFSLVICILPLMGSAQWSITGSVADQNGNQPVANASVFLNNTTIGAETEKDGSFRLPGIKPGKYELVITVIGFQTYHGKVIVNDHPLSMPVIHLSAKTNELKEVVIKARDKNYSDLYYQRFKNEFLGTSDFAGACKILNPALLELDFDETSRTLNATSADFLEIENDALGYKIKYLLNDFRSDDQHNLRYEGSVLFTEMKGTPAQQHRWEQNRQDAYEGSPMHFLRTSLEDTFEQNGFQVLRFTTYANAARPSDSLIKEKIKRFDVAHYYKKDLANPDSLAYWKKLDKLPKLVQTVVPYDLNRADIISNTDHPSIFALGCDNDTLLIIYKKNHHFAPTKQLANLSNLNYVLARNDNRELTALGFASAHVFFDQNGGILDVSELTFKGAWGKNRIAELLPTDYEPRQRNVAFDDTLLRRIAARVDTMAKQLPVEKVYLHLDKPGGYFSGDTIWYKAYTVIGQHHQLSALSGVLYVELISPKDSVISRQTLHLFSGVAWSDIPLARALKWGNYRIRAYTNWMRNSPGGFYDQPISIGGVSAMPPAPASAKNPDVQFFPEGGNLVEGVRSRVAIKSVGAGGLGQDIQGSIVDNEGTVVADFNTARLGMGAFVLTPQNGKTYMAKIGIPGEAAFNIELPKAADAGYILALNNSFKDSIYLKVAVNDKILNEQRGNTFYIIAQSNGKVYYTARGKLDGLIYIAKIEKNRFPTGISQFTLLSQNGEPLAERIAFMQNADSLQLHLSTDYPSYAARGKVKLALAASDNAAGPVGGSFSVAVINESRAGQNENNENTILSELLLSSDLKGFVEQPNYYFTNTNDQKLAELDLLMLTQGYRRFEWKKVMDNARADVTFQPEKSLELSGQLKTPSGKAVPFGKITLMSTRENFLKDTIADAEGHFRFPGLDLSDTAKVILRARKENNGSNVDIYVLQPDFPLVNLPGGHGSARMLFSADKSLDKDFIEYQKQVKQDSVNKRRQLKEVIIKSKKEPMPDVYNRYGSVMEYDVDMQRLRKEFFRITDALIYVVPGMKGGPHHFVYEDTLHGAVKVIIDGFERSADDLNYYLPDEVESLRMVSATGLGPPVLILTTKRYAGTDTSSAIKLKEVKIKSAAYAPPDLSSSANIHPGSADQVIMGDRLSNCVNLSDCLIGKIIGVNFKSDGTPVNTRISLGGNMSVIIDGMVMDGSHLNDISANDIYSIEVLRSGAARSIYGSSIEHGGAIVVTLKNGSQRTADNAYLTSTAPAGLITFPLKGYYRAKIFYSPKYTHSKTETEPYDLRNTVYWNPGVVTGKDGAATFEYFNSDTKGIYRVVVEGIDGNGNLGRQVYRYRVE